MSTLEQQTTLPVSVVVITRNEAPNIDRCLASVAWADEVVVVDNESTDETRERAMKWLNVTLITSTWLGFSETKRVGVRTARHDWIFWLDADEVVPPALAEQLARHFRPEPPAPRTLFSVRRKTYFLGAWIRGCGWYPSTVVRIFNRKQADFSDNVLHESVEPPAGSQIIPLDADLLHDSYVSLQSYFGKMAKYAEPGASELARRGAQASLFALCLRPFAAFLRCYFVRGGFKDGMNGFVISVGSAFSVFIKYTTYYYYARQGTFLRARADEPWERTLHASRREN